MVDGVLVGSFLVFFFLCWFCCFSMPPWTPRSGRKLPVAWTQKGNGYVSDETNFLACGENKRPRILDTPAPEFRMRGRNIFGLLLVLFGPPALTCFARKGPWLMVFWSGLFWCFLFRAGFVVFQCHHGSQDRDQGGSCQ